MSEHVWSQENIASYVAGGLSPAEGERLDRHLGECTVCEQAVADARALEKKLAPLFTRANPGPALEDRLLRALPTTAPQRRRARLTTLHKAVLAAAAIILLGVLGAGISSVLEEDGFSFTAGTQEASASNTFMSPEKRAYTFTPQGGKFKLGTDLVGGTILTHESPKSVDNLVQELHDEAMGRMKGNDPLMRGEKDAKETVSDAKVGTANGSVYSIVTREPTVPAHKTPSPKIDRKLEQLGDQRNPQTPPMGMMGMVGGGGFGGGFAGMAPPGTSTTMPTWNLPGQPSQQSQSEHGEGQQSPGKNPAINWKETNEQPLTPLTHGYYQPGRDKTSNNSDVVKGIKGDISSGPVPPPAPAPSEAPAPQAAPPPPGPLPTPTDPAQDKQEPKTEKPEPKTEPKTDDAPRKIIIRTGELEFEVDSFDASVAGILRLVGTIKGAFVATINSDKLPNGKVRGSVVVRVPPEFLDNFVLDLRGNIGKSGELKNQRIGSQDITKHYTDLESRLRASRTMEERLLAIIKDGKGQIKDLLQAEKELGVWRTQIEELVGELRYYSNLASLSTLTVKLYEKDIQIAATLTESERIQAGIEVEDVEKAQQIALKAILDAKGRVTRSELKQHLAGQFNAILHFEVEPEAAGPLRDMLKQLGNMVRLQVDRVQQTEDGTMPTGTRKSKVERGNTRFEVSLYNLANIAPRETVVLRLAVIDVPATYQKLREAVAKAKGHVVDASLNEQDRQNISAKLDFDIRRLSEADVLIALAAAGETLSRQVQRVPESDNVTDAKVLFRVALIDANAIQPRETLTMRIAVLDVPAAYQKLRDAIAKAKARVINADLNEKDRSNVSAQLDFTFHRREEGVLQNVLAGAGETLSRQVARLPESSNVTDAKVLARVELIHADSLPPRETVASTIAALDVPAVYETLRAAVVRAKGRIVQSQLLEKDRKNMHARLHFDIPRAEEAAVQAVLAAAGETLTRQLARQPENSVFTDTKIGYQIDVSPAAAITPRETNTLALEVRDVSATLSVFGAQVKEAQGRVIETQIGQDRAGQVSAHVVYDVPLTEAGTLVEKLRATGQVRVHQVTRDPQAPEGKLALARLSVTLSNVSPLVPNDDGLWSQIRHGLGKSLRGLIASVGYLIIAVLFVGPWLLILYTVYRLTRRFWARESTTPVVNTPQ